MVILSLLSLPLITLFAMRSVFADAPADRIALPIEVLGVDASVVTRTISLQPTDADSARSLWLQVHGLRYANEGSVQVNDGPWIPLDNDTVVIPEPGKSFGGIGGGFATLSMTIALPSGAILSGANAIRFRFNETDGFTSAYRVLALNFLAADGKKLIPPENFAHDSPETWTAPFTDAASISVGRQLWESAPLISSSLPNAHKIQARCADCHAHDGRDLKYFNFSNASIVDRSRFHGLSAEQGEQIASYIRSLRVPNPGRPWNPPYQPGPGLDDQPVSNWAAGAGLDWVLDQDTDALPYIFAPRDAKLSGTANPPAAPNLLGLAQHITPDAFRPDGNLNPREIPIALQLPDWSQWLPRIHPKDAWGVTFTQSEFAALYDGSASPANAKAVAKPLRTLLAGARPRDNDSLRGVILAFAQWSQARRAFLKRYSEAKAAAWSPTLTDKIYSTQLWQLVKTWEMTQEFGLDSRARDLFGPTADSRSWLNTVPMETAPSAVSIPDGSSGAGGSALTNEYLSSSWYELQILLNSGNHQHRNRGPVDWVYVVGRFRDLYDQSHQPEPARLLVAVIKAMQSTDPRIGPDNFTQGWRPEQNVDPRIMISPVFAPIFKPLPREMHQALTASLLAAWMDKNSQYPIAKHLPMGQHANAYALTHDYAEISGGKVWESAQQFSKAGVSPDLVRRLQQWGLAYKDRASRIQY